jgi:hypothetical protein
MAQPPFFFAAQIPPNVIPNAMAYAFPPGPPMPAVNLGANRDVPVRIISANASGMNTQLSKAYPRHILLALSGTVAAWLTREDGRLVRTITIKDERVSRAAGIRILNWLFELWAGKSTSLQIPFAGNETFDVLTQLYQGILYLDLGGQLRTHHGALVQIGNQSELRNKIWHYINHEQLTKEDVKMTWTRLRDIPVLRARCVHEFIDQVDAQNSSDDVWAEYQTYFHGCGNLWPYIKSIRDKKTIRIIREQQEQEAQGDDGQNKEEQDLAEATEQLTIED